MAFNDAAQPPVGFVIVRLAERIDRGFVAALRELDLTARQLRVLVAVDEGRWLSQRALAAAMGLDPGNLVAVLDALEQAGGLGREPDPDDRRRRVLTLTASGRRLLKRAREATAAVEDEVLEALTGEERRQLEHAALKAWR